MPYGMEFAMVNGHFCGLAERFAGEAGPDVLTLATPGDSVWDRPRREPAESAGGVAVAERPPRVECTVTASSAFYSMRRRTLVIRHASDDRIVALLEIVSQSNKSRQHGAIWAEIDETPYEPPRNRPLTFVAYSADVPPTAYVQPMKVGDLLWELPLFLTPARYVEVPLETTYAAAWRGMPQRWRRELEPQTGDARRSSISR